MRTIEPPFIGAPEAASSDLFYYDIDAIREPNLFIPGKKPIGPVEPNQLAFDAGMTLLMTMQTNFRHDLIRNRIVDVAEYYPLEGGADSDGQYAQTRYHATGSNRTCFNFGPINKLVSTTGLTICLIRKRTDSLGGSTEFGLDYTGDQNHRVHTHLPSHGNKNVYFDVGAGSTYHRVDFSHEDNTEYEKWLFTHGKNGQSIWLNGVIKDSNTKIMSYPSGTTYDFLLGAGENQTGHTQNNYYFSMANKQWSDALIHKWFDNSMVFLQAR